MSKWKRETSKDGGKTWTDWTWGKYRLEQGRDNWESARRRPWLLLRVDPKGRHVRLDAFATLEEGQRFAEERAKKKAANKARVAETSADNRPPE
jgi:hypothetical protein